MIHLIGDGGGWNRIDSGLVDTLNREAELKEKRTKGKPSKDQLASKENKKDAQAEISNAPNLNGYVYVPSIKLYVAEERTLLDLTWIRTQEELKKQKLAMLTPYQFREFLKYIRDSKDPEHQKIFKDITEVKKPWRSQWLNAKFDKRKNGLYMISENVLVNGKYLNVEQKLDDFLAEDKFPGISLDDWINSNASHGLPTPRNSDDKLYYWAPVSGRVARLYASSDRVNLSCNGSPLDSNEGLGVRACAGGAF